MDLTWSADEDAFRAEARAWLEANTPHGLPSGDTREGFALHLEWERLLYENRWAVVSWPEEFGGRGASLWEWLIFEEEYYRAGGPQRVTQNGIFLLAPTVFEFGTPEQQARILPGHGGGRRAVVPGLVGAERGQRPRRHPEPGDQGRRRLGAQRSEDLDHPRRVLHAPLRPVPIRTPTASGTRASRTTSSRSTPTASPCAGFGRLDGDEGFAEVFFEDAFVPDDNVLGGVNEGWSVAMATTGSERGLTLRSPGRFMATAGRLLDLYRDKGSPSHLRHRVVDAWIRTEAYQLFTLETVTRLVDGGKAGAESSINKIWWSELDVELHEIALDLIGADLDLDAPWEKGYQFALSGPIYAGTNEIQRNIAAERVLGLPRA